LFSAKNKTDPTIKIAKSNFKFDRIMFINILAKQIKRIPKIIYTPALNITLLIFDILAFFFCASKRILK